MGIGNTGMNKDVLLAALKGAIDGKSGDVANELFDEIIKHIQTKANVKLAGILLSALQSAVPVPGDGGAALKTQLIVALQAATDKNEIG